MMIQLMNLQTLYFVKGSSHPVLQALHLAQVILTNTAVPLIIVAVVWS